MVLDSSITAVQGERDTGFIMIIYTIIMTSGNHINYALTKLYEADRPLPENIIG